MCPVQRCQMILIHHDQFLHNYELNKMKKVKQTFINALNIVEMVLNQVRCQHELITPHIKTLSSNSMLVPLLCSCLVKGEGLILCQKPCPHCLLFSHTAF